MDGWVAICGNKVPKCEENYNSTRSTATDSDCWNLKGQRRRAFQRVKFNIDIFKILKGGTVVFEEIYIIEYNILCNSLMVTNTIIYITDKVRHGALKVCSLIST